MWNVNIVSTTSKEGVSFTKNSQQTFLYYTSWRTLKRWTIHSINFIITLCNNDFITIESLNEKKVTKKLMSKKSNKLWIIFAYKIPQNPCINVS